MLVYDGDCGFCEVCASWSRRRLPPRVAVVPWQQLDDLARYGLTTADVTAAAYWLDLDGDGHVRTAHAGHRAIVEVLKRMSGPCRLVGRVVGTRALQAPARLVYDVVARNRHRLPGGRAACRMADAGRGAPAPRLWGARLFAYGFIALLLSCVAFGVESWPLSSFRLFSEVRGPEERSWSVVTVDDGVEQPIDWASMPAGYKGWHATAGSLDGLDEADRSRILRAWATGAARAGREVDALRVYRVARRVPTARGVEGTVVSRTLRHELRLR